ncbi:MAG TPA: DUF6265 family protein [Vicinamibacterales bacterium]|nr:DUF6265 family protein [Vicinamibacterales bacterium]
MSKTMARYRVLVSLTMLGCAVSANAQDHSSLQQRTPNTLTAAADVRSPRATVGDMAWFAGKWTGTGLGGVTEETWSAPADGAMMGMFRLVKDGKVVFYEFLTLVEEEGSLALKLKLQSRPDWLGREGGLREIPPASDRADDDPVRWADVQARRRPHAGGLPGDPHPRRLRSRGSIQDDASDELMNPFVDRLI